MALIIIGILLNVILLVYFFSSVGILEGIGVTVAAFVGFFVGGSIFGGLGGALLTGFFAGCALGSRWI